MSMSQQHPGSAHSARHSESISEDRNFCLIAVKFMLAAKHCLGFSVVASWAIAKSDICGVPRELVRPSFGLPLQKLSHCEIICDAMNMQLLYDW